MAIYNRDGTRGAIVPTNHFNEVGENLKRVLNKVLKNDDLVKLLYYNLPNVSAQPNLTNAQKVAMVNDYIKLVPKIPKDIEVKNYLIIQMNDFSPVGEDFTYRTFVLNFDVLCHADNWIMDDYMLRPMKILHELDSMFNNSKLDSLGPVNFVSANQLVLNEDLMGYTIFFRITNFQ
jgi:hypothetical protein